jgi:hypothetical protein
MRILMWLALVGGIFMLAGGGYEFQRMSRLKSDGIRVVGRLFDHSKLATGKGRTSYHLVLDYEPKDDAQIYRKEFFVTKPIYDAALQTQQAGVIYLPSDPTESVAGDTVSPDAEKLAIGGGLLLLSAAVWFYYRRKLKQIDEYIRGGITEVGG